MAEISWIKLSVNLFDDEKIKVIKKMPEGDKILLIWIQLLCLAGKTNDGGTVYMGQNIYYTDEMLATVFDETAANIRLALSTFQRFDMIRLNEEGLIKITNWEKHQNVEGMERVKTGNAKRQQLYYWRKKLKDVGVDAYQKGFTEDIEELKHIYNSYKNLTLGLTLPHRPDIDIDKDRDIDIDYLTYSKYKDIGGEEKEEEEETSSDVDEEDDFEEINNLFMTLKGNLTNTQDQQLITQTLKEYTKDEIKKAIEEQRKLGKEGMIGSFAYIKAILDNKEKQKEDFKKNYKKPNQRQKNVTKDDRYTKDERRKIIEEKLKDARK